MCQSETNNCGLVFLTTACPKTYVLNGHSGQDGMAVKGEFGDIAVNCEQEQFILINTFFYNFVFYMR